MKRWMKYLAALAACGVVAACNDSSSPQTGNLAQVATDQGFNDLVAAATKADLVSTLTDPAVSLTVFAPTDAAFDSLAGSLGFADGPALVAALDGPTLAKILTYHILGSKKTAADLSAGGPTEATLYDFPDTTPAALTLDFTAGVKITDAALTQATVVTADVPASNGVIHAVDKVLVPPGVLNVVQMAQVNPIFSSLVGALVSANLTSTLSGAGPFTVFAPTNDAFTAASAIVASLDTASLTTVLTYHVLPEQVLAADIPFGTPVGTVAGSDKTITINAGTPPTITDSTDTPADIVATDVRASNGVIHVIDKVLIPTLP
jgi:transforming growth factor-beta-induced protein